MKKPTNISDKPRKEGSEDLLGVDKNISAYNQINYTSNLITFTCKFPKGRSKIFLSIRLKKNNVQFEFSGQSLVLSQPKDLTSELMNKLKSAFNN